MDTFAKFSTSECSLVAASTDEESKPVSRELSSCPGLDSDIVADMAAQSPDPLMILGGKVSLFIPRPGEYCLSSRGNSDGGCSVLPRHVIIVLCRADS